MSRSSSEREILVDTLIERLQDVVGDLSSKDQDLLIEVCDWYAEQKIKQMFDEENNRNEGKIKVRTENGILMLTPGEFEEYKKIIDEAILREVK